MVVVRSSNGDGGGAAEEVDDNLNKSTTSWEMKGKAAPYVIVDFFSTFKRIHCKLVLCNSP